MRDNIGLYRAKPKTQEDYYYFSLNHKDNCKDGFVFGSLVVSNEKYYICVFAICNMNFYVGNGTTSMVEVIPETVGEYIGLKDKNSQMIFEGDIVKKFYQGDDFFNIGIINWDSRDARWACQLNTMNPCFSLYKQNEAEIIGNIHDNLELLKGGEVE